jgi:hypothetical protein
VLSSLSSLAGHGWGICHCSGITGLDERGRFRCADDVTFHAKEPTMGMENYSKHQQGIIKRYYQNIDQITWQKLSDLVGDLYLAEGKKRDKLWQSVAAYLVKLEVPKERIDHIVAKKEPEMLARLVKELMES